MTPSDSIPALFLIKLLVLRYTGVMENCASIYCLRAVYD